MVFATCADIRTVLRALRVWVPAFALMTNLFCGRAGEGPLLSAAALVQEERRIVREVVADDDVFLRPALSVKTAGGDAKRVFRRGETLGRAERAVAIAGQDAHRIAD